MEVWGRVQTHTYPLPPFPPPGAAAPEHMCCGIAGRGAAAGTGAESVGRGARGNLKGQTETERGCCSNHSAHTLPPSLYLHSLPLSLSILPLSLSPPSTFVLVMLVSLCFSIRFVLTSPGRAPLTLPADDTRGGGGRGDEEKPLSLLSRLSITLKEKRESRPEQKPKERTHRMYIHT